MKVDEVKRILTIGAGTMGHQIGFLCALHGYEVVTLSWHATVLPGYSPLVMFHQSRHADIW
jgi:3-hydroxyacyl-CoA dehydrogenase